MKLKKFELNNVMQDLSSFLDKFKKILTSESIQREKVALIIGEVLSVKIDPKSVVIKNGTAKIGGSSVFRNEIFLRHHTIMEKLKSDPTTAGIREVR